MNEAPKIGKRKYQALKEFDFDDLTEEKLEIFNNAFSCSVGEAIKQIASYEKENNPLSPEQMSPEQIEKNRDYMEKVREPEIKKEPTILTKDMLWKMFTKAFRQNEGMVFNTSNPETIENIKPLIYYFLGDFENFAKCKNMSLKSKPHLQKGLLIIGRYGCGKTSIMKAFERCFTGSNMAFRGYTSNKLVQMFEACQNAEDKADFNKTMVSGIRYFDDVLSEREASNYGKTNLLKDILEERYDKKLRTHITLNYKDGSNADLQIGIEQLAKKYGPRIYDRIFDMFNIIEFKGVSFRK